MDDDASEILGFLRELRFGRDISPEAGIAQVRRLGADEVLGWMAECSEAGDLDGLEAYLDNQGVSLCEAFGPDVRARVQALHRELEEGRAREDAAGKGSEIKPEHPHNVENRLLKQDVEYLIERVYAP